MSKAAYFISDLHLGASYIKDSRAHEARVVSFLDSIADKAGELFILGDALDYWFEYRTVVPRGYVRFFGALARLADRGVKITWFIGNHDIWLFDYLRDEIGIEIVDGYLVREVLGKRFFMSHGDGVGRLPLGFRLLRATFRNRTCQKLYSAIHPRWTIPFAHRWSNHSRHFNAEEVPRFEGEEKEPLVEFCREYLADTDGDIDFFVFGHRHTLVDLPLSPRGSRMIILGDWLHHFSYGLFDGKEFSLNIYEKNEENI